MKSTRTHFSPQVYGLSLATVLVGYQYSSCARIVWEARTAKLHGFLMEIADIGGWNLNIHHMYNFETGERLSNVMILTVFFSCFLSHR